MGPTALHSLQQRPHVDQLILRDEVTSSSAGGKIKAAGGQICSATAREIGGDLTIGVHGDGIFLLRKISSLRNFFSSMNIRCSYSKP